jgi:hypothetical protein
VLKFTDALSFALPLFITLTKAGTVNLHGKIFSARCILARLLVHVNRSTPAKLMIFALKKNLTIFTA